MRAKKVPAWASNLNYSTGPAAGTATKIAPTTGTFQNGFLPGEPMGAQYDSYWRHHVGRQTELSARLALRNLLPVTFATAPPLPSLPLAATYTPNGGVTFLASADSNKIFYVPAYAANASSVTVAPAAGAFIPRTIVPDDSGAVFVFGTNSTAPTKSLWAGYDITTGFTECTMPVTGGCYKAAYDRATNKSYAFFEDTNRSVFRVYTSGGSQLLVATRPGKPVFAGAVAAVAVNNDVAIVARISGGVVVIDYTTLSTSTPPSTWTTVNVTDGVTSPTTVFDVRWSDSYQCWMLLTDFHIWAFTNPAGPFTKFNAGPGGANIISGALFDVGSVLLYKNNGTPPVVREIWIRDDLDTPSTNPEKLSLGTGFSGDGFVVYDGSAIFMNGSLAASWLRTLRVS